MRNEELKLCTLTALVLAKIMFYNLLPKSREYSHAWGSTPLLIYCLLKSIRVNIPKLIIDFMLSEHLLIPNRNLPFGMLITRLLKFLKFDVSGEKVVAPSIDISSTLLKRMHLGERALIPPLLLFHSLHPDPPPLLQILLLFFLHKFKIFLWTSIRSLRRYHHVRTNSGMTWRLSSLLLDTFKAV